MRAGNEVERSADAKHAGSIEFIEAACGKQFLTRRAERDEAELGAGGADAVDRDIGLARIGIEIRAGRVVAGDLQSAKSFRQALCGDREGTVVGTHHENREPLPSRLPADRFHEIRAGRAPDPCSQETTEHHNRKAVRSYKSGTLIGGTELRLLS